MRLHWDFQMPKDSSLQIQTMILKQKDSGLQIQMAILKSKDLGL